MTLFPAQFGLPHSEFRPAQLEALQRSMASGSKILVLELPPGVGKSSYAISLARSLDFPSALILTGTKQLQAQYSSLPGLVSMMGRGNFECGVDRTVTAAEGACVFGGKCPHAGKNGSGGTCGYYDTKRLAQSSPEVVTNYAYFLAQPPGSFLTPNLLIFDECHILRHQLETSSTLSLRLSYFRTLNLPEPYWDGSSPYLLRSIVEWAELNEGPLGKKWDRLVEWSSAGSKLGLEERKTRAALKGLLGISRSVLESPENWVVSREMWGWELKPIWVRGMLDRYIEKPELVVFMSATILDAGLFLESLGIDEKDVEFLRFGSPFPVKNRPIYYWPVAKVSGKDPSSYRKVISAVDEVIGRYPNEKGLVHSVNYSLAKGIMEGSRWKGRLVTHGSGDREEVLRKFRESSEPLVLVSPSMGVGVDLPGEECRFNIIPKIPFPDLQDPQRVAQAKEPLGKKLQMWDTVATLVQTYGRAMRSEEDFGDSWVLDSNLGWVMKGNKGLFPEWFTEAVVKVGT